MLATQVQYLNWLENRRHNEITEIETHRANRMQEYNQLRNVKATEQSNKIAFLKAERDRAYQRWATEEQNKINERNAMTNRINAINSQRRNFQDWNLGLQAQRMTEYNAQTNRINAQTSEAQLENAVNQTAIRSAEQGANAAIGFQNAATQRMNAETNRYSARMTAQHYQWSDTAAMINSTANVANAIFRGVQALPAAGNLGFVMGRI